VTDPLEPNSLRLRPARPDDREFYLSTRKAAFRPYVEAIWGWDEAHERAVAEREFAELPVQIVESGTSAIGYLCVLRREDHDFLDEIALLPRWQGQGIGTFLMRSGVNDAARRGVPLRLSVLFNNPISAFHMTRMSQR
jgi:GNAT superfamily N-acetyltransferase